VEAYKSQYQLICLIYERDDGRVVHQSGDLDADTLIFQCPLQLKCDDVCMHGALYFLSEVGKHLRIGNMGLIVSSLLYFSFACLYKVVVR